MRPARSSAPRRLPAAIALTILRMAVRPASPNGIGRSVAAARATAMAAASAEVRFTGGRVIEGSRL